MKISVLLSTFNGEKYLKSLLQSLEKQTFKEFSILIRDDGSTDSTPEILLDFVNRNPNAKMEESSGFNYGVNKSFQKLLKSSLADFYIFCDQDDIWKENKLEELNSVKVNASIPLIFYHNLEVINNSGQKIHDSFWQRMHFDFSKKKLKNYVFENHVVGCGSMINKKMRDLFLKIEPKNILMYDHTCLLISKAFGREIRVNKILVEYRDHPFTVTEKKVVSKKSRFNSFFKNLSDRRYLSKNILQLNEVMNTSNRPEPSFKKIWLFYNILNRTPNPLRFILFQIYKII